MYFLDSDCKRWGRIFICIKGLLFWDDEIESRIFVTVSLFIWSGGCSVITCRLHITVDLKHPLDNRMALFETDPRLSSSLLLVELYTMHP